MLSFQWVINQYKFNKEIFYIHLFGLHLWSPVCIFVHTACLISGQPAFRCSVATVWDSSAQHRPWCSGALQVHLCNNSGRGLRWSQQEGSVLGVSASFMVLPCSWLKLIRFYIKNRNKIKRLVSVGLLVSNLTVCSLRSASWGDGATTAGNIYSKSSSKAPRSGRWLALEVKNVFSLHFQRLALLSCIPPSQTVLRLYVESWPC